MSSFPSLGWYGYLVHFICFNVFIPAYRPAVTLYTSPYSMALDHMNFGDHLLCRVYLSVYHEWSEGNLICYYFLFRDLLKELLLDTMENMCSWDSREPYLYSLWGNIQCTMETLLKVTIIGAPSVGKTSYVHRYVHGSFRFYYKETMGGKCFVSWMKFLTFCLRFSEISTFHFFQELPLAQIGFVVIQCVPLSVHPSIWNCNQKPNVLAV